MNRKFWNDEEAKGSGSAASVYSLKNYNVSIQRMHLT